MCVYLSVCVCFVCMCVCACVWVCVCGRVCVWACAHVTDTMLTGAVGVPVVGERLGIL